MITTHDIQPSVRRCAVCRVDLKGRFVYVDDSIEKLMGYTREELFGKKFIDFVDEPDKPRIQSLIARHNRYETNFDSIQLHLRNRNNESISAHAIVALNFITGNPVNYQIILDSERTEVYTEEPQAPLANFSELAATLLGLGPAEYVVGSLEALYHFVGVNRCIVYHLTNNEPEPLFSPQSDPQSGIRILPVPKKLLRWVASSDETYSFANTDDVRRAIERAGVAPSEFICKFALSPETYLLRVECTESPNIAATHAEIAGLQTAARLIERLAPVVPTATATTTDKPAASVLEELRASLTSAMRIATLLAPDKSPTRK